MPKYPNELTTRFLDGVLQERPTKEWLAKQYIGLGLMPFKSVSDYELSWDVIRSANRIAGIYAMDGTPIPGDDPSFYQRMANVINIMAARRLDEQTVMTFREPGELALKSRIIQGKREKAMRLLRKKIRNADDEVDTTIEYLITQTLQGSITWPPVDDAGAAITPAPAYWGNTAGFTLDLGFRSEFVQDIDSLSGFNARAGGGQNWQHPDADPLLDFFVIQELMTEVGNFNAYGSVAYMSNSALSWMATRPNVIRWYLGWPAGASGSTAPANPTGVKFVDYQKLQNHIQTALGFEIRLYDSKWTYETNVDSTSGVTENSVRFLPINKMFIVPPGALNADDAYFATAPISGPNDAYKTGKQTWSDKQTKPPWSWEIGVQLKGFPILKSSQELAVFTLW